MLSRDLHYRAKRSLALLQQTAKHASCPYVKFLWHQTYRALPRTNAAGRESEHDARLLKRRWRFVLLLFFFAANITNGFTRAAHLAQGQTRAIG